MSDADQNCRRGTKHGYRLRFDFLEDSNRIEFPQTDMSPARRGNNPDKGPAVGVKHRQRPEIAIAQRHRMMEQGADDVRVSVAMSDHHSFRSGSSAAGVID